MIAEIITIGDELLIGQTVDTNSAFIGQELSLRGIRIGKINSIQDDENAIVQQLDASIRAADLVIITGGLGPTKDDITKETLTTYFGGKLVMDPAVLSNLENYFAERNRPMLDMNRDQALVPDCCEVLFNNKGTAPGMWFEKNNTIIVSLPGVPYEMKGLMLESVLPRLIERKQLKGIYHRSIQTTGIGESFLAKIIEDWENKVREDKLGLAYLPSPGLVKLRLTSYVGIEDKELIDSYFEELIKLIPTYYFGEEEDTVSSIVGKLLLTKKATVGTVESCTAGGIASEIVKTSGASAYFEGSVLTYSYRLKEELVGVDPNIIKTLGAVSKECVEQMALGGRKMLGVDYCLAASGIAGPDGATDDKPVGTVWIALAYEGGVISRLFQFGKLREINTILSSVAAVNMLRMKLLGMLD